MDLATMVVILLFKGGEAEHFFRAERGIGACMGALGGKSRSRTPESLDADYVVYRICLPGPARMFSSRPSTQKEDARSDHYRTGKLLASTTLAPRALYLRWRGEISTEFYNSIAFEFEKSKQRVSKVMLDLSSGGGDRQNMERAIRLLRRIKRTHALGTLVDRGETCASACVFIFLQGRRRWAALTSSWLFHEVAYWGDWRMTQTRVDRAVTGRVFEEYFPEAGVNERWLNHLRAVMQHSDYWQTGDNLWQEKSGVITDPLDNHVARGTEQPRF